MKASNVNITSDIVNIMSSQQGQQNNAQGPNPAPSAPNNLGQDIDLLKSIDSTLKEILSSGPNWSQSDARNMMPGQQVSQARRGNDKNSLFSGKNKNAFNMSAFEDGLREGLMDALLGSDFKDNLSSIFDDFANQLGVEVSDIPNELGKQVGKQMMDAFKDTGLGKDIMGKVDNMKNQALAGAKDLASNILSGRSGVEGARAAAGANAGANVAGAAGTVGAEAAGSGIASAGAASAGAAVSLQGLALAAGAVGVAFLAVVAAAYVLGPAFEGTAAIFKAAGKAANRNAESREKNLELAQKRLQEDIEYMVKYPFEILEKAADELYKAWDSQIRLINGTQGYSKDDLYELMGQYAERLRDEGMTRVISTSEITENLGKVLESGLSGTVATEFAYLATKLNAAIPTQDFFNYAATYASLAANAIKNGKSESEAIQYANNQMEEFASNVLYASRQLSGGFSTGLKDAQSLFESSAQIVTAAKTGDASLVSGVLTSVAAIVGSIAPDLSSSVVESIVKTAVGGNSSDIVALRSLAGINASNTEFLKALATNPQEVFTTLFSNLAKLQSMSNDNFMEVAEGLSDVFGISMDAFARVDFNYLAQAISAMNVNNNSLSENIKLLASGETTTTAEQLRMQQINEYMLEEGLSYVLDNEAARAIQEHMWDEQRNRELMEATYAVELQGSALQFLEGISQTVKNLLNLLNPVAWISNLATNLALTAAEGAAQQADLAQMLELGKVGKTTKGSLKDFSNLTSTNKNLNLTTSLVDMMGGVSMYGAISNLTEKVNAMYNAPSQILSGAEHANIESAIFKSSYGLLGNVLGRSIGSQYSWANIGKSFASALASTPYNQQTAAVATKASTSSAVTAKANSRFQEFIDTISTYVDKNKSYDEWKASATQYGIKDFATALEENGVTEAQLQGAFQSQQVAKASEQESERQKNEDAFWKAGTTFWTVSFGEIASADKVVQDAILAELQRMNSEKGLSNQKLQKIIDNNSTFFNQWADHFIKNLTYTEHTSSLQSDLAQVQDAMKLGTGDAILQLAKALTSNEVDLKDPMAQTNVLLSEILIVAQAIMQQNNKTGGTVLPTTMSALALGLVGTEK